MPDIAPGSGVIGRGDLIVINLFCDATRIAHVLGLDIELPDCDNQDPACWEQIHANGGYKRRIAGLVQGRNEIGWELPANPR